MTSWMRTSASVLKSCRNLLFLSGPVFSATSSWKRGSSCRHSRAMCAAFSETPTSACSSPAMAGAGGAAALRGGPATSLRPAWPHGPGPPAPCL